MKKLLILISILSFTFLVSCSDNEFDKAMKEAKKAEKEYKDKNK